MAVFWCQFSRGVQTFGGGGDCGVTIGSLAVLRPAEATPIDGLARLGGWNEPRRRRDAEKIYWMGFLRASAVLIPAAKLAFCIPNVAMSIAAALKDSKF